MGKGSKKGPQTVGFNQMLRDVLVASINKGVFPFAGMVLVLLLMIFRMQPEDVGILVFRLVDLLERGALFGYILAAIGYTGWYIHARRQRRIIAAELDRVSYERNKFQETVIGRNRVKSSEGAT